MSSRNDTVVIGAGIVGLAVARTLAEGDGDRRVVVLEKEDRIAAHQTGHNSGVVHAGLYYKPGSMKAKMCRRGVDLLRDYADDKGIELREAGKLVIARDEGEIDRLDEIERRARANGVPDLRRLPGEEIAAIEPHAEGVAALHSPHTAVIDFRRVAAALADDLGAAGGEVRFGFEVSRVERGRGEIRVRSSGGGEVACGRLVVCAGLQSDRVARLAGAEARTPIVPFRGEYHRLVRGREDLVRGLIYPVPDPAYPFLGVHFTRRIDGRVDIGPNAVLAFAREGYRRRDVSVADLLETLRWRGFRALARRHWRMGLEELRGSLSKRAFLREARSFVPELEVGDVEPAPAGVRAQAVASDGSLVDDFLISRGDRVLVVGNAPSPAATSSLAIAEHVADQVRHGLSAPSPG